MKGRKNNNIQNSIIANNAGIVDLDHQKSSKKHNHFFIIFPIIIFIFFSSVCFGGYYYYENYMVESTQSIYLNYLQKIDLGNILDEVLYSKISNKNNSTVHNTNAQLSVKSKTNQDGDEDFANSLIYDFDIFSNPQSEERYVEIGINYGDNNLVKLNGVEQDKYMALSCPDILDDYIVWEKENTAYFMSKISNIRSKFDYNKIIELFDYQNIDFSHDEKNELLSKAIKIISKNTKKTNYEERPNVTFTDENGDYVEAIGYKLSLNSEESNKISLEIIKALKEDDELIDKITQNNDTSSNTDITTSNVVYKILESIALEKKLGVSSSKLKSILDAKMIEIENTSKQGETTLSIYIMDEKIRFLIADDGQVYIKCEFLEDSSLKLTYLTKEMPQFIDGTIKDVISNFTEAQAFVDKALDGDFIVPDEPEDDEIEEESPQMQPGNLRSIRVVGNDQTQEQDNNNTEEVNLSTSTEQNVESGVNISEQNTNNSNANQNNNPTSPDTSTVNAGDGGTITIGEQGDVTYRNAPREIIVGVNSDNTLSREDIIENSNVGEVDFSSDDDSDSTAIYRPEEHDIDNTSTDLETNLTDTSLYSSSRREFEANSTQSNGFTLILKRGDQNTKDSLNIEYDEIKNSQISSKYIVQINIEGTAESTEIKNDMTINYYDNSGQKLINLKYFTKYGENTTEVPDIQSNSLILDDLSEEDFENAIAQIRGFILKYIKLKENQWNLITRNG